MARLEALINQDTVAGNRYNAQANSEVDTALMARLEALINQDTVAGNRYNPQANSEVDTEVF